MLHRALLALSFTLAACGGSSSSKPTAPAAVEPDACGGCPEGQTCDACPGDPSCPACDVCGPPVCRPNN